MIDPPTSLARGEWLDPQALARLRRLGGDALLARMLALFLEHAPDRADAALRSADAGDPDAAAAAAHALRSSAGNLGAWPLVDAAARLEAAARAGEASAPASWAALAGDLRDCWRQTYAHLLVLREELAP